MRSLHGYGELVLHHCGFIAWLEWTSFTSLWVHCMDMVN